jgi:hypothetical protein
MISLRACQHNDVDAHSRFGGSIATRIMRCPASVTLTERVPAHLRRSSSYADRGTACHAAMALLLDGNNEHSLESLVGKTINNYTITLDDVENALRPVYSYVDALLDTPGAEYYLEHRVIFPTIANACGTADLLVRIGTTVHVIDFKFGAGVRVLAVYPDGAGDVINAQLLFYAAAARYSLRQFFADIETIALTILQPVSIEPDGEMMSSVAVAHAELDAFIVTFRAACEEALSEAPRLARGEWCRFCAARPICPVHTGPLFDLARLVAPAPGPAGASAASTPPKEVYLKLLADGLNLVDAIKDIRTALHDQAKRALQSGDVVPGYTLSAGRAERHWKDESAAIAALACLGLNGDDVVVETMRSPKQIEIRAKARGLKVPPELIVSHRSGASLMKCENARAPVRGRGEIVRSFSAALETFRKGEK